jgi:hypothetical protein
MQLRLWHTFANKFPVENVVLGKWVRGAFASGLLILEEFV